MGSYGLYWRKFAPALSWDGYFRWLTCQAKTLDTNDDVPMQNLDSQPIPASGITVPLENFDAQPISPTGITIPLETLDSQLMLNSGVASDTNAYLEHLHDRPLPATNNSD